MRIRIEAHAQGDFGASVDAARDAREKPAEDRGLTGFIARMFSGALPSEADVAEYENALDSGRFLLVVHVQDDDESNAATSLLTGPSVRNYSLPNAPTAWRRATAADRPSIGDYADHDPARPEGLIEDAAGLSAEADRDRARARRRP